MLCMNQIVNMAAKARYMFGGAVQVPMVVRAMIGKSWGQGPQHSQALHALFTHIPGLKVVAPSNPYDAKGCMIAAIRDNNPVVFVEHRLLYYTDAPVPEPAYEVRPGTARICTEGSDLTLVGISNMVVECLRAGELLGAKDVSAEVVDPIWLSPLDIDTIVASARKTRRVLVVDNAWTACGVSAEILAAIAERTAPNGGIVMERMGFAAVPCPTTPSLEDGFYPTPATIATKAFAMVPSGRRSVGTGSRIGQAGLSNAVQGTVLVVFPSLGRGAIAPLWGRTHRHVSRSRLHLLGSG